MDALALEAATAAVHADYPPGCEAVLIVELEGPREVVETDRKRLDEILAGSNAAQELIDAADLGTEMKEIKHPFQEGMLAQKGWSHLGLAAPKGPQQSDLFGQA